jgi:hypothetical protein
MRGNQIYRLFLRIFKIDLRSSMDSNMSTGITSKGSVKMSDVVRETISQANARNAEVASLLKGYFSCFEIHDHPHLEGMPYLLQAAKILGYEFVFAKYAKEYSEGYFKVLPTSVDFSDALVAVVNGTPMIPEDSAEPILSYHDGVITITTFAGCRAIEFGDCASRKWVVAGPELTTEAALDEIDKGGVVVSLVTGNLYSNEDDVRILPEEIRGTWRKM